MKPFISVTLGLLLVISCGNKFLITEGNDLEVKKAFLQKVYPGQKHGKITDNLNLAFEFENSSLNLDSVYFFEKVFSIDHQRKNYGFDLSSGKKIDENKYDLAKDKAIIFYHVDDKAYLQKIHQIKRKESLYLP